MDNFYHMKRRDLIKLSLGSLAIAPATSLVRGWKKPIQKDGPLIVQCCGKELRLHAAGEDVPWDQILRWVEEVRQVARPQTKA